MVPESSKSQKEFNLILTQKEAMLVSTLGYILYHLDRGKERYGKEALDEVLSWATMPHGTPEKEAFEGLVNKTHMWDLS